MTAPDLTFRSRRKKKWPVIGSGLGFMVHTLIHHDIRVVLLILADVLLLAKAIAEESAVWA